MEIKVTAEVIKFLVARHMSAQVNRYVKPSDVMFASEGYGDNVFDLEDKVFCYAFTNIEDELEEEVEEKFIKKPNCKYYHVDQGKGYCNPGDNRKGDCVLLTKLKDCTYRIRNIEE